MVTRKGFPLTMVSRFQGLSKRESRLDGGNRNEAHRRQNTKRTERAKGYRTETFGSLCSLSYKTLIKKKGRSAKSEICIFHYADLPQTGKVKNPQARFPPFPARPASSFLRFRRSCFLPCPVHRKRAERVGALVPSFSILYKTVGGKGMGAAQISFRSLILRSVFRSHMRRASPSSSG